MPAGRPFGTFKFDSLAELDAGIEKYFNDCDAKPVLDGDGNQITDKHGKPAFYPPKPYTVEGLALALNITPTTLCNYAREDYADGNYFASVNRARIRCLNYASERLYDKEGSNGAKFYATNNSERMGGLRYADRQEVSMDIAPVSFVNNLED